MYETGSAITSTGALTAYSGAKTGRSPLDKRIVKEEGSEKEIWWGPVNKPMTPQVSTNFPFATPHGRAGFGERVPNAALCIAGCMPRQSTPHLLSYRQVTCLLTPFSDSLTLGLENQQRTGCRLLEYAQPNLCR